MCWNNCDCSEDSLTGIDGGSPAACFPRSTLVATDAGGDAVKLAGIWCIVYAINKLDQVLSVMIRLQGP